MEDREALERQVQEMLQANGEDSRWLGALTFERAQYVRRMDRDTEVIVERLMQREGALRSLQVRLAQAEAEVARGGLALVGRAVDIAAANAAKAAETDPPPAAHGEEAAQ